MSVTHYDEPKVIVEKNKIRSVLSAAVIIGGQKEKVNTGLYIQQFNECFLIWELNTNMVFNYQFEEQDKDNYSKEKVMKEVTYLWMKDATIYSSTTGLRKNWVNLQQYITTNKVHRS